MTPDFMADDLTHLRECDIAIGRARMLNEIAQRDIERMGWGKKDEEKEIADKTEAEETGQDLADCGPDCVGDSGCQCHPGA